MFWIKASALICTDPRQAIPHQQLCTYALRDAYMSSEQSKEPATADAPTAAAPGSGPADNSGSTTAPQRLPHAPLPPLWLPNTPQASPVRAAAASSAAGGEAAADVDLADSAAVVKAALSSIVDKPSLYLVRAAQATRCANERAPGPAAACTTKPPSPKKTHAYVTTPPHPAQPAPAQGGA